MKKFVFAAIVAVGLIGAISCQAADERITSPSEEFTLMSPVEKLGRGIANVAFGPLEILIRPWDVNNEKGAIASLTYGVIKGAVYVIAREIVGVVDIVTFLFPLPGCTFDPMMSGWGYGPIMRPAWVVDVDHNAYNFFFNDSAIVTAQ